MIEIVLEALTGQAGGITAITLAAFAGYRVVVKHILPQHRFIVESIVESHSKDRAAFIAAIDKIDGRMDILERDVGTIKREVGSIKSNLKKAKSA